MLPADRRQQIIKQLQKHGIVHISELSQEFAVSEMTIHRDLDQLEKEGHLHKVRGGAVPVPPQQPTAVDACFMCHATPRSQTQMTLHMAGGSAQRACCPHCGLHGMIMMGDQVVSALAADFLRGNTVDAQAAAYVIDPDITICCKPTVLSFQKAEDAQRFQRGFGGQVLNFADTIQFLRQAMRVHAPHHQHKEV
ncbi:MAG: DeoR family transcriptional regulator [Chloroflexi bacterium]|nr:DeoR family transcriptional regulator [Chloroflexota bacterium]